MKRSEMILKMQRYHGTQYCMIEAGYITLDQFYDDMLQMQVELGMVPTTVTTRTVYEWDFNKGEVERERSEISHTWELE